MQRLALALAVVLAVLIATAEPEAQGNVCSVSATGIAFGNYDVTNPTALDGAGSITSVCGSHKVLQIALSQGSSGSFNSRQMRRGVEILNYNLFLDAARTIIWGDGTGVSSRLTTIATPNTPVISPVYGRVVPLQDAAIGFYSDSLVVTVSF